VYHILHYDVKCYLLGFKLLLHSRPMRRKGTGNHQGTLNIRGVSKDFIYRIKMAAAAERRTVKGFFLALAEERIQELERKGILPKGK